MPMHNVDLQALFSVATLLNLVSRWCLRSFLFFSLMSPLSKDKTGRGCSLAIIVMLWSSIYFLVNRRCFLFFTWIAIVVRPEVWYLWCPCGFLSGFKEYYYDINIEYISQLQIMKIKNIYYMELQSCKRTDKFRPEPKNISPNPARTRKLIWSPNHARKNSKVMLDLKNLAMLPSYFNYIFVHLRQKVRVRPEWSPKFLPT